MTTNKSPLAASLAIHIGMVMALFTIVSIPINRPLLSNRTYTHIDLYSYHRALKAPTGGGGGMRSLPPVSKGQLPKQSPRPFTPPMILVTAKEPVLLMEPALLTAPEMPMTNLSQWGDPLSNSLISSGGPGSGGGMGGGKDGGIGDGKGPRHGHPRGGCGHDWTRCQCPYREISRARSRRKSSGSSIAVEIQARHAIRQTSHGPGDN